MTSLRRRPLRRALGLLVLALALTGCGAVVSSTPPSAGRQLAVFSSLPLQGPEAAASQAIVNGEKLALEEAHGHVGKFGVSYYSLDDSDPNTQEWSADLAAANAKVASQDKSTIAYLGEYDSGATAISLPLINDGGILQVSPASGYVGLTSSTFAGQDEPARFYPTGTCTFGRNVPTDLVQGAAAVALLRKLGVHSLYVIGDLDAFNASLAQIVTADAQQAGINVLASDTIDMTASDYSGEVKKVDAANPGAVFYAGDAGTGAATLFHQLYAASGQLKLIGSSAFDTPTFTASLGDAAVNTYFTTPVLAPRSYPAAAQRFFAAYRREYGYPAPAVALYGYDALQDVLISIAHAGSHGDVRSAVTAAFLSLHNRNSVLGRYSIQSNGDTTLTTYGADRVVRGEPVFYAALDGTPPPVATSTTSSSGTATTAATSTSTSTDTSTNCTS
jgi:branched-chain amino acid transport system substrate-binding protein